MTQEPNVTRPRLKEARIQGQADVDSVSTGSIDNGGSTININDPADAETLITNQLYDVLVWVNPDTQQGYVLNKNGIVTETKALGPGANPETLLDDALTEAVASPVEDSSTVRLMPIPGQHYNLNTPSAAGEPHFTIPKHVSLDMRGVRIRIFGDSPGFFHLEPNSSVWGHGARLENPNNLTGGAGIFLFDGTRATIGSRNAPKVMGYPTITSNNQDCWATKFTQTDGSSVSMVHAEVHLHNGPGIAAFESANGGNGGFVNDNVVLVTGKAEGASTLGSSGTTNLVEFVGADTASFNTVQARDVQTSSGVGLDDIARFETGGGNAVVGEFADQGNTNGYTLTSGASAVPENTITISYGSTSVTNNSGGAVFKLFPERMRAVGQDLTGLEGGSGAIHTHDASGSVPYGPAVWDPNQASGSGNWVSLIDGTVFGPN